MAKYGLNWPTNFKLLYTLLNLNRFGLTWLDLDIVVCLCPFPFFSFLLFPFMFVLVLFCLFLSVLVHLRPFLSVSDSYCLFHFKYLSQVILNITVGVLNMNVCVLNMTGLFQCMTKMVLNMTRFDLFSTIWVRHNQFSWSSSFKYDWICPKYDWTCPRYYMIGPKLDLICFRY